MPEQKDDPRQVLAVLNSLGYVGITAQVLKAFMKDLKLLRKIKERDRQQWREEMKKKIFFKQQKALAELLNDSPRSDATSTLSSNDSVVKIKIRCISASDIDDDNYNEDQQTQHNIQRYQSSSPLRQRQQNLLEKESFTKCQKIKTAEQQKLKQEADTRKSQKSESEIINSLSEHTNALVISEKVPQRSRSKSITTERSCTPNTNPPTRSSSRSRSKSFIRPWNLRLEAQRPPQQTKSDPVMLYQKYQEEWKKFPLPGENLHTRLRWEIREKMLGTYPIPKPILKKSFSSMSVKKR